MLGGEELLAVDIDVASGYAYALAGQTHTPFHVVLAAVDGAPYQLAELPGVGQQMLAAVEVLQLVIVGVGHAAHHRVAGGEVEHHDVAGLDRALPFQTVVGERGAVEVAFSKAEGHLVVHQREIDGGHGHSRAVDGLVHEQVVAGEQRLFKRRRRYLVILPQEGEHEIYQHQGVDDGVYPRHERAHGLVLRFLPPGEGDETGDVDVE